MNMKHIKKFDELNEGMLKFQTSNESVDIDELKKSVRLGWVNDLKKVFKPNGISLKVENKTSILAKAGALPGDILIKIGDFDTAYKGDEENIEKFSDDLEAYTKTLGKNSPAIAIRDGKEVVLDCDFTLMR